MKKVHVIAHTHWDYEWYFSRQEARVQFAYHMEEVFDALKNNQLEYYMLDGQMAIIDDYLQTNPDKKSEFKKYNEAGRLFLGPWYTQIDEFTTSGESVVRNLRMGMKLANDLGGCLKLGYLPDSFGQSKDMPKIYNGFGIKDAVFWRGLPKENKMRHFKWESADGSTVFTVNISNGYYVGGELIEKNDYQKLLEKISAKTDDQNLALPLGGDQRAIDLNVKAKIQEANSNLNDAKLIESTYPQLFKMLKAEKKQWQTYRGEFNDPSVSKIHRGIYSSRYDLKQIYDELERILPYQLEPLMTYAKDQGIIAQTGIVQNLWKTVAQGQAHDSAGGCNSDKTNTDILNRGKVALQTAHATRDYLLKKMSISDDQNADLYIYNPLPIAVNKTVEFEISTSMANFILADDNEQEIFYDKLEQRTENNALLRRNPSEMKDEKYYVTKIAFQVKLSSMSCKKIKVIETNTSNNMINTKSIKNEYFELKFSNNQLCLVDLKKNKQLSNFINFIDEGDEGDNYDYSPAFADWKINLNFDNATISCQSGKVISKMWISGSWNLPYDLVERKKKVKSTQVDYQIELILKKNDSLIGINVKINNTVKDHRLRLVLDANLPVTDSYADTQFGIAKRVVSEKHLTDWKKIGYHEEPTALRPMLHFANMHNSNGSLTFITCGMKSFEIIGDHFDKLGITLYRSVGYLGRPDLKRRPGDASGLERHAMKTPDSQLMKVLEFEGGILYEPQFDVTKIQQKYLMQSTQNDLVYQRQNLNRYTTPIEYFPSNKIKLKNCQHEVDLINSECVLSSFNMTQDQSGYELRIYNPKDKEQNGGELRFVSPKTITQLDLNGRVEKILDSNIINYEIGKLEKEKILTLGIF